ncbi:hypothetical protein BU15DRAFT_67189 [Melanogaster broomeanus]|nr:hypothetical protein BU15DRAFT_67189 [Melanogaster broomeanus]
MEHLPSTGDPPTQSGTPVPTEGDPGKNELGDNEEDRQVTTSTTEKDMPRSRHSGTQGGLIMPDQRSTRSIHSSATPRCREDEDPVGNDEIKREFGITNATCTLAEELQRDYESMQGEELIHPDMILIKGVMLRDPKDSAS